MESCGGLGEGEQIPPEVQNQFGCYEEPCLGVTFSSESWCGLLSSLYSCLFLLWVWWGCRRSDPKSSAREGLNFPSPRLNTNLKAHFTIKARRSNNRIPASLKSPRQNTHWQRTPGSEDFFPLHKGQRLSPAAFLCPKTKIYSACTGLTWRFSWVYAPEAWLKQMTLCWFEAVLILPITGRRLKVICLLGRVSLRIW